MIVVADAAIWVAILQARVPLEEADCLAMGLDVRAWLREGSVDYVVGQDGAMLIDTNLQSPWLPQVI